jgi:hypothetical protein
MPTSDPCSRGTSGGGRAGAASATVVVLMAEVAPAAAMSPAVVATPSATRAVLRSTVALLMEAS